MEEQLFFTGLTSPEVRSPLVVAYGIGLDSTGMLVGMRRRNITPDLILSADTGNEKDGTYRYIPIIQTWLKENRFPPLLIVAYRPKNARHGHYRSLGENCLRNATLPSLAFGYKSCSLKWKVAAQNKYCQSWPPAMQAWARGIKVTKAIGYDCSPQDQKRYAHAQGQTDPLYNYIYPLQQWGWDRERCQREILAAGLPVPPKSACFFCPKAKPHKLHGLPAWQLKQIVIMEARAKPHLRSISGVGCGRPSVRIAMLGGCSSPRENDTVFSVFFSGELMESGDSVPQTPWDLSLLACTGRG
jgi:hypothetical protein